jgi:glycerophosphoryl diester phosphodiesterase
MSNKYFPKNSKVAVYIRKLFFLFILIGAFTIRAKAQPHLPTLYNPSHHVVVIAHRGYHIYVPGNTIAAYKQAIAIGADYVEVDLRETKDEHLVVMHDATVNRMTSGKGKVKNLTYKDIKGLKIHGIMKGDHHIYHVPDFKQVLALCKGHINIYLDFKDANVTKTWRLIKAAGMENHVAVYINKKKQYGEWKKTAPQIPLIASIPEENVNVRQIDSFLGNKDIKIVDNAYSPRIIKILHSKGIEAWLDTESEIEDASIWQKMLNMGADGLQTDHPRRVIQYLERQELR